MKVLSYKEKAVLEALKKVIPEVTNYAWQNKENPNIENMLKGDLYTRLRRELNDTKDIFHKDNIDKIYCLNGEVLYIGFLYRSYSNQNEKNMVDMLSSAINKINPNFKLLKDSSHFNSIINSINRFNVT